MRIDTFSMRSILDFKSRLEIKGTVAVVHRSRYVILSNVLQIGVVPGRSKLEYHLIGPDVQSSYLGVRTNFHETAVPFAAQGIFLSLKVMKWFFLVSLVSPRPLNSRRAALARRKSLHNALSSEKGRPRRTRMAAPFPVDERSSWSLSVACASLDVW